MKTAGIRMMAVAVTLATASVGFAGSADDIIDAHIKAIGGEDKIAQIKTFSRVGDLDVDGQFGPMQGTTETKAIVGKKAHQLVDMGVFYRESAWTGGNTGWEDDAMQGLREVEGPALAQTISQAYVSPLLAARAQEMTFTKLEDEEVLTLEDERAQWDAAAAASEGVEPAEDAEKPTPIKVHVIEMDSGEGIPAKVYINKETNLIHQVRMEIENDQFGIIQNIIEYSDWEEIEGVKMPGKMTLAMGELLTMEMTYTETEINPELTDEDFAMPEVVTPADTTTEN